MASMKTLYTKFSGESVEDGGYIFWTFYKRCVFACYADRQPYLAMWDPGVFKLYGDLGAILALGPDSLGEYTDFDEALKDLQRLG